MKIIASFGLLLFVTSAQATTCKALFMASFVGLSTPALAGDALEDLSGINGYYHSDSPQCQNGRTLLSADDGQIQLSIADGQFIFSNINEGNITLPATPKQCLTSSTTDTTPFELEQNGHVKCHSYTVFMSSHVSFNRPLGKITLDVRIKSNDPKKHSSENFHCVLTRR